jgi:hypothetical protein
MHIFQATINTIGGQTVTATDTVNPKISGTLNVLGSLFSKHRLNLRGHFRQPAANGSGSVLPGLRLPAGLLRGWQAAQQQR